MGQKAMSRPKSDILRVLSDIYGAGLGDCSWTDALRSVAGFFGGAGAVVFDLDRNTGEIPAIHLFGVEHGCGDYVDRMNAINPRMHRALAQPGCHTAVDYDVLSEAEIGRSEFYDWLQRDCGVKYAIGSRMLDRDEMSSFISVELSARHGHAEPDEIEMFRLLTLHFANAWRISQRLGQALRIGDLNDLLQQSVPWGVVALDHSGRVLSINAQACRAIGRGDGLRIERGQLHALRSADDRALQNEIALSLRSARGEVLHAGGAVAVGRRGATVPYGLRIVPLRHIAAALPDRTAFVVVFVSDPVQPGLPNRDDLIAIFGLTPREAEVALHMAHGTPLVEISKRLRIARNTARTHLANAMVKTGARTQGALVGLIRGLPGRED